MEIPDRGVPHDDLLAQLEQYRQADLPWRDGRTWAYCYDAGPEVDAIAKAAYLAFLSDNALDPTVFPSLLRLENEVVGMCRSLLHGDDEVVGNFTTGGTESCMLAVKTARDHARKERGIEHPQLILPATAHAAFHKACQYFDVEKVVVPVTPGTYLADPEAVRAAITDRTVQIVGSAVSYAHGVIDPIEELAAIAQEHDLLLHVDGCIGAFLLSWWEDLGVDVPRFDFRVPGVTSISMDLHKYGFCPKPASVLLQRGKQLRKHQVFSCADWTGYTVVNPTLLSTRSGGPVAASWAVLRFFGKDGYRSIMRKLLDGTQRILAGLARIDGLRVLGTPQTNLVAIASDGPSVFEIADEMKQRRWYVQPQLGFRGSEPNIHLSIQPQCLPWIDEMLADLQAVVTDLSGRAPEAPPADLGAMLAQLDPRQLDDATFAQLLGAAGVQGAALPDRMAGINQLLDSLPPAWTEEVLREFLNQLYTPA